MKEYKESYEKDPDFEYDPFIRAGYPKGYCGNINAIKVFHEEAIVMCKILHDNLNFDLVFTGGLTSKDV